ncbi:MAG: 16S rRNA (adenine(1518)-N(6)/adenine(1519)-N(6))-dimethyltransferase RsmA [Chitinivibrionales bacterium]|nr:16S rRNA (adenine(1518)-N(6)/adenine(1519)-N(6))-dimethyltransferase RsmA [Chitinivibrionales bacterium]
MAPKKRFGQHFLTAPAYARRIAEAVEKEASAHILEIGPGKGALSAYLVKRFPELHCIEIDPDCIAALRQKLGEGTYTIHQGDILEFNCIAVGTPLHVVGNLPYSLGAMILKKILYYGNAIRSITFMVQREVALRIAASPGVKENGFLTIFCQFFGKPKILFNVPAGAFFPRPNVESAVFQMKIYENLNERLSRAQWEDFFGFVDKSFKKRRKMLINSLDHIGVKTIIETLLNKTGIAPTQRPEELGVDQWLLLYKGFTCA